MVSSTRVGSSSQRTTTWWWEVHGARAEATARTRYGKGERHRPRGVVLRCSVYLCVLSGCECQPRPLLLLLLAPQDHASQNDRDHIQHDFTVPALKQSDGKRHYGAGVQEDHISTSNG